MALPSISLNLPKLNLPKLDLGNIAAQKPAALSTPSAGKGFSTVDSFEAAPQRAQAKPEMAAAAGHAGHNHGAQTANAGNAGNAGAAGKAGATGAAGTAGAAGAEPGGDIAAQLNAIIQQLQQLIAQLQQMLAGGGGAAGGAEAAKAVGGGGGGGGMGGMGGAQAAQAGTAAVTDQRLQEAMQRLAQDPEGAKLVQAAQAQGLKVQIGDLPPGVMGQHQNGVITISPNAMKSDADLIHTLAHELGHAATRNDGNSINEEKSVDAIAQRIQQRIAPGQTFQLDIGSYKGLQQDNGVRNSLAQIGLQ